MNKTNIGIAILLCMILLATLFLDSPCKAVFSTGESARQLLKEYNFDYGLDWEDYGVQVKSSNLLSPNHEFMKALDPNYLHMIIRQADWETDRQDLSFVLFKVEEWNKNADMATENDTSKLPPIVYFNDSYVYSLDPYDYDQNKKNYDEIINILYDFSQERNFDNYRMIHAVTIETDSIIYKEAVDQINLTWRNILKDDISTTGDYTIEEKINNTWQEVFKGRTDQDLTYLTKPLDLGYYRISVDYERLSLFSLPLNESYLYKAFAEFDVGESQVKREGERLEGIGLETEYQEYPEDTLIIKCKWYNQINDSFTYGSMFSLEKFVNKKWQTVDFGDIAFTCEGYTLGPGQEAWHTYNMSWILDSLDKGSYRIKTSISRDTLNGVDFGAGNYPSYLVYSPFVIGDQHLERPMTFLKDFYHYKNEAYGFTIDLEEDWQGLILEELEQDPNLSEHDLYKALDPDYKLIQISHPSKDIRIKMIVFESVKWNNNAHTATASKLNLLPEIMFSTRQWVFSTHPDLFESDNEYYKSYQFMQDMQRY